MNRYAILIGVSEYQEYGQMPCAANDVRGMAALLTSPEHGLFSEPIIFDRHEDSVIKKTITRVFKQARSEDQILLYYSGHGEIDRAGKLHLITANTEKDIVEASAIPARFIREQVGVSHCERVMVILDCCFSGAFIDAFKSDGVVTSQFHLLAQNEGKGIYILTASAADETAKQGAEYSILTSHILTGIREGKADTKQDGLVDMNELSEYVKARFPQGQGQTPQTYGHATSGKALTIARTYRVYSPEERRTMKKKINDLDSDDLISSIIAAQARRIIESNQPLQDKDYFTLLQQICAGEFGPGTFSQKWLVVKPSADKPVRSDEVKTKPNREAPFKSYLEDLNGVPLEMMLVPAGKFMMGSDKYFDEKPIHEVRVPSFYIGKFPITQKQWQAVMGKNPSHFKGDELPVESVSWRDAQAFCEKLRTIIGKAYRLPSEAEWEYACRAGTTEDHAGPLNELGWYIYNSGGKTHSVGQKKPNAFGLHDMHGNIWEWCEDVWHENYNEAPRDGSVWTKGGNQERRVMRGGSWNYLGVNCRSATRGIDDPGVRNFNFGFRVVVSARTL